MNDPILKYLYGSAPRKKKQINRRRDSDHDGVPDYRDCQPFNPFMQDWPEAKDPSTGKAPRHSECQNPIKNFGYKKEPCGRDRSGFKTYWFTKFKRADPHRGRFFREYQIAKFKARDDGRPDPNWWINVFDETDFEKKYGPYKSVKEAKNALVPIVIAGG